jgi:hypothetical protein
LSKGALACERSIVIAKIVEIAKDCQIEKTTRLLERRRPRLRTIKKAQLAGLFKVS